MPHKASLSFALLLSLSLSGCSHFSSKIDSPIFTKTKLGELSESDQKIAQGFLRGAGKETENVFDEAASIDINGYSIIYPKNQSSTLYVVKNKNILAGISENKVQIYKTPLAPAPETESAYFSEKLIKYKVGKKIFEIYTSNGEILGTANYKEHDNHDASLEEATYQGETCKVPKDMPYACCRLKESLHIITYASSLESIKDITNQKPQLKEKCSH